ncbi:MAG: hypothetical protein FJ100_11220 [Deltaproteobacteria bacterium]|nr:hypothetical protein [Deltaproteobacteria bacterium]
MAPPPTTAASHSASRRSLHRASPALLCALAAAVAVAAVAWRTERFVPDDAYFYLVVARNLARFGQHTFSGVFDTDGVHPLWTWMATAATWALDHIEPRWVASPRGLLALHYALLAVGAWTMATAARALGGSALLAGTVATAFVATMAGLHTEAAASYVVLALLSRAWLAAPRSVAGGTMVGALAAFAIFARLDHGFLAVAILFAWHRDAVHRRCTLAAWLAMAMPVATWLLWHRVAFGAWVPVSGWLKSTAPALCPSGIHVGGIASALSGWNLAAGWAPLAAMGLALHASRGAQSRLRTLVWAFAIGCALHAAQVALLTHHPASWLWYYVAPVLGGTWALVLAVRDRPALGRWLAVSGAVVGAAYASWVAVRPTPQSEGATVVAWLERQGNADATLLVSDSPGEIAFRTRHRVVALDLLTANPRLAAQVHAAPDPTSPLFEAARRAGRPVQYLVVTTGTWLSAVRVAKDAQAIEIGFLRPGACRGRSWASLPRLGRPLVREPGLTVWKVGADAGAKD